jgi:hypothetical protein
VFCIKHYIILTLELVSPLDFLELLKTLLGLILPVAQDFVAEFSWHQTRASRITHHASRLTHHASRITHHASRITHDVSHITYHASCITYHAS